MGKTPYSFLILHPGSSDTVGTQISFQGNQALLAFTARQNLTLNITEKVILELMTPLSLLGTAMVADFLLVPGLGPLKRTHLNSSVSVSPVVQSSSPVH